MILKWLWGEIARHLRPHRSGAVNGRSRPEGRERAAREAVYSENGVGESDISNRAGPYQMGGEER